VTVAPEVIEMVKNRKAGAPSTLPGPVCADCHRPIFYAPALDLWRHSDTRVTGHHATPEVEP
jgi:hypothetical protein